MNYLKEIKNICSKYHWDKNPQVEECCKGCPFDYGEDFDLKCDSGVYSKYDWDVDELQFAILKEIDKTSDSTDAGQFK